MQLDEENQGLVHERKQNKKNETRSVFSTICYGIQFLILILLVFLVFKFALVDHKSQTKIEQVSTDDISNIDDTLAQDKEDQDIMQFLMSPEDVTQFDNLIPEHGEETFEELIFEAEPWSEGQLQGWQFKNGLTLVVQEKEVELSTIELIIYHGYHDDEYNTLFMQLLAKNQCVPGLLIERAFMSTLIFHFKNELIDECLKQLGDSFQKQYTEDDLNSVDQILTPNDLISKIDRVLDAISMGHEIQSQSVEIQDFQNYIELLLVSNPVRLMIESPKSNQEIYMSVSDTQIMSLEFGNSILDSWDIESILYNQIRINSNQTSTILVYPIKQDDFFQHLLLQKSSHSLQNLLNCEFEILDFDFLGIRIQDCSNDSTNLANSVYSFASFLKRQSDKTLMNNHKDFYNLQLLTQRYIDDQEFSRKDFNMLLDNIQSGVIIIQEGEFVYQELKILNKEEFLSSNFVNKKVHGVEYSSVLLDYTNISNLDETLISQLKLVNLTQYIPLEQPQYNFYTAVEFTPPLISLPEAKACKDTNFTTDPEFQPMLTVAPLDLDQSSKKYPIPKLTPIQISQELWWQYDNNTNRVFFGMLLYKPINGFSIAKTKAILKVAQVYIEQVTIEALSAGFNYQIESSPRGLSLILSGWSGTFNVVKKQVLEAMQEVKEEASFKNIKTDLKNSFQEYYYMKTQYYLVQYWLPKLMLRPVNDPAEIIQEFQDLQFNDFSQYLNDMFSEMKYTAFVSGNIDIAEARELVQDYHPNDVEIITKTLNIENNLIYVTKLPAKQKQNAVLKYYAVGQRDPLAAAALLLLQLHFENQQQIQVTFKSIGCVDGLLFYNQGSDSVLKLNEQIQQLIDHSKFDLEELQDKLILHYENNDEYLWDKIYNRNYAFNEIREIKQEINNVTQNDLNAILKSASLTVFGVTESQKLPSVPANLTEYSKLKEKSYYECQFQYQSS